MRPIFVDPDSTAVGFRKSILEEAGIACFIQNESTSASFGAGMFGLVQSPIFDPVLCIVDDSRYDEAMALLQPAAKTSSAVGADWCCPKCGELVPANFEKCWNCSGNGYG